jgi:predicted aspartyl protease
MAHPGGTTVGVFRIDGEVVNVRHPRRIAGVRGLLVDSGSEFTWLPEATLIEVGIEIAKKDVRFLMANGDTITRPIGYAIVRAGGFETVDEVVFARPGDLSLLGARTLEGFGAVVDARRKRLVAAGPHPAALADRSCALAVT